MLNVLSKQYFLQRPQSVTHVDKVKRIQADLLFPQGKCGNPFPECTTPSYRFVLESHVTGEGEKYYIEFTLLSQNTDLYLDYQYVYTLN